MNTKLSVATLAICSITLGCTTPTTIPRQNFSDYLDSFVGQSAHQIQETINFEQFGFHTVSQPLINTTDKIVYRIERKISLPLPTFTGSASGSTSTTYSNNTSMANSYQVNLNCDIYFNLQENKIISWEEHGKGC